MAGFCTRCGSPLPESGVCPNCAPQNAPQQQYRQPQYQQPQYQQQYQQPQYQQPQYQQQYQQPQYQQPAAPAEPSAFSIAMGKFKTFLGNYIKSPAEGIRSAVENGELMTGLITIVLTIAAVFLTLLAIDLRYDASYYHSQFHAGLWFLNTFITPVLMYGLGLGGLLLIGLAGGNKRSFASNLAATGSAGLLPTVFIVAALILSMFGESFLLNLLYPMLLICMGVSYCITVTRAMDNKMNLWQTLILVAVLLIGYLLLDAFMQHYFAEVVGYYSFGSYLNAFINSI